MKAQVLIGSKNEIAETVNRISGRIHEMIVFVEEPSDSKPDRLEEDIFAEMEAISVKAGGADYRHGDTSTQWCLRQLEDETEANDRKR